MKPRGVTCWPVLLLLLAGALAPARADVDTDSGLWAAALAQGGAGFLRPELSKVRWWLEGQVRTRDDFTDFDQSIVRPGVGYTLFPQTVVWMGYGWFRTSPENGSDFDEHRIWQQLTWSRRWEPLSFALRTRLEQRFLDTGDETGWRFRQWLKLTVPLPRRFSLAFTEEVFVNFNGTDYGARSGFDQNRFFAGVGYDVDEDRHVRLEAGYLNRFVSQSGPDGLDHLLSLNLILTY